MQITAEMKKADHGIETAYAEDQTNRKNAQNKDVDSVEQQRRRIT